MTVICFNFVYTVVCVPCGMYVFTLACVYMFTGITCSSFTKSIVPDGQTALGPALVISIKIAGQAPGSKVSFVSLILAKV